jgi:hypothetical protein
VYDFDWGDISADATNQEEENWRKNMYVNTDPPMTPEQIYNPTLLQQLIS